MNMDINLIMFYGSVFLGVILYIIFYLKIEKRNKEWENRKLVGFLR